MRPSNHNEPLPVFSMGTFFETQAKKRNGIPMTVDQFIEAVRSDRYREQVSSIHHDRATQHYADSLSVSEDLPIFYPIGDISDSFKRRDLEVNTGLAVYRLDFRNPNDVADVLAHLRAWSCCKAYFSNCRGHIIALIYLGNDLNHKNWVARYREAAATLNHTLPHVGFIGSPRMIRGILLSYDPMAYCRPDGELTALP